MGNLEDILENRKWLRHEWPFTYISAKDVFKSDYYYALTAQVKEILDRGLSEVPDRGRFSRNMSGYDSYGIGFSKSTQGPLAVFLSSSWRDTISNLFGIGITPYIFAGSHHHTIDSADGFIHNDFNPSWFPHADNQDIQIPNNEICSYKTGAGPLRDSEKVQVVRGVAVLFFLLNDGWQQEDGGEIGLFTSSQSKVTEPALCCPPINNSLVAFECTPHSFHSFLKNKRISRTSIIMWVHRPIEEAVQKFGKDNLEQWKP